MSAYFLCTHMRGFLKKNTFNYHSCYSCAGLAYVLAMNFC